MALAGIAALEGLLLLAYAVYYVVEAIRTGITGPAEVSNPAALMGLIAITAAFGAGLVWTAVGWWTARSWARSPFVVAQLVLGLIGYELTQSAEGVLQTTGQVAIVLAVIGVVLAFLPSVRRAIDDRAPDA